jgi:hypothetical protein
MTAKDHPDITAMLAAWNDGSAEALDRVIDIIYPELRRIARKHEGAAHYLPRADRSIAVDLPPPHDV